MLKDTGINILKLVWYIFHTIQLNLDSESQPKILITWESSRTRRDGNFLLHFHKMRHLALTETYQEKDIMKPFRFCFWKHRNNPFQIKDKHYNIYWHMLKRRMNEKQHFSWCMHASYIHSYFHRIALLAFQNMHNVASRNRPKKGMRSLFVFKKRKGPLSSSLKLRVSVIKLIGSSQNMKKVRAI